MKLINYRCIKCNEEYEEIFSDNEEVPEILDCYCGSKMKEYNFKNNKQRVFICDPSH